MEVKGRVSSCLCEGTEQISLKKTKREGEVRVVDEQVVFKTNPTLHPIPRSYHPTSNNHINPGEGEIRRDPSWRHTRPCLKAIHQSLLLLQNPHWLLSPWRPCIYCPGVNRRKCIPPHFFLSPELVCRRPRLLGGLYYRSISQ